jgi:anti-anti-sigma factor
MESQPAAIVAITSQSRSFLDVACRTTPDGVVVEAAGEIDYHSAPLLRERLDGVLDKMLGNLTLDLRSVIFIDSSGLSLLLSAHLALKREGRSFRVIVCRRSQPARVISLGRFETLLQLAHEPDESDC